MKKRVLVSMLCVMLSVSMGVEAGAEMFTDSPAVTTDVFTETAENGGTVIEENNSGSGEAVGETENEPGEVIGETENEPGEAVGETDSEPEEAVGETENETGAAIGEAGEETENETGAAIGEAGEESGTITEVDMETGTDMGEHTGEENDDMFISDFVEDAANVSDTSNDGQTEEKDASAMDVFSSGVMAVDAVIIEDEEEDASVKTEYYRSDWEEVDGNWKLCKSVDETSPEQEKVYYTLADGIVHIVTVKSKKDPTKLADAYYLFDKNGNLVTGRYKMKAGTAGYPYDTTKEYFYMDDANASYLSDKSNGAAKTPYNSNLGQLQKKYWLWTGSSFRYYDKDGKFTSVNELKETGLANGTYVGYYKINGECYSLKSSGVPRTGRYTVTIGTSEKEYFFSRSSEDGIPGKMLRNVWIYSENKTRWRYFGKNGYRTNYSKMVTKLNTSVMGNYQYLLDKDGYLIKNKPAKINGTYYYANSKGRIVKNSIITYNGKRYYFTANGKRATYRNGWYRVGSKNRYYYFDSSSAGGRIKEKYGWQRINKQWYYFPKSGNHYVNYWTKSGRYFYSDGHMATGLCSINGSKYYFRTAGTSSVGNGGKPYKSTIVKSGSTWYYAKSNGKLTKSGWITYGGNEYYLKNYKIQKKTFAKRNGVNVYLDSEGKYQTGWIIINDYENLVKYVNPYGNDFYKNTTVWINGLQYRFDSNGYRVNDRTSEISGPYYVEVDIVNCVMTIYNSSRNIPVKSIRISPGAASTPTPTGTYYLNRLGRWWTLMGPSYGQYCTHVVGAGEGGIIIHSVPSIYQSVYSFSEGTYNLLGQPASHGCIRCCVADSKWVYDYCQESTIRIFRGNYNSKEVFKGPLGRRPLVKATGSFDPTDPAVVG